MKLQINVIQSDINRGLRHKCNKCPVALALQRTLLDDKIFVSYDNVYFQRSDKLVELPYSAKQFIAAFDNTMPVNPFSFEIDV